MGLLAIDVDLVRLPTSALELLVIVLLLSVVASIGLVVLTTAATPLVDRRWPADEPLNPTEMLWGESGGYIKRHFPGLDVSEAKDINAQFTEVKVPAGENVVEQGDPATHFYVVKSGEVEVLQRTATGGEQIIRTHGAGDTFGEVGILRRTPRTATIRAVTDTVVLQLPAQEFVAGVAFSAAEGNELMSRVNDYLAADAQRGDAADVVPAAPAHAAVMPAAGGPAPAAADVRSDLGGSGPGPFLATHRVPASGLLAWVQPDAAATPVATLPAGVELRVVSEAGAWARVTAANGWEGWVDGRSLIAL